MRKQSNNKYGFSCQDVRAFNGILELHKSAHWHNLLSLPSAKRSVLHFHLKITLLSSHKMDILTTAQILFYS